MLLLKAAEHNWGMIGPGEWEECSWEIDTDGQYRYTVRYVADGPGTEVTSEGKLSPEKLEKLKEYLSANWSEEETWACDGTAWEFGLYENGEAVRQRELGYIYGIEPFEGIAELLSEERSARESGNGKVFAALERLLAERLKDLKG